MRNYPEVPRRVVTDTYFGVTVEDPYRYMEDKDAPEVKAIVAAENAYTKAFFDSQPKFSTSSISTLWRSTSALLRSARSTCPVWHVRSTTRACIFSIRTD